MGIKKVKLTQEEVLERFKSVHGDRYDYSKMEYVEALKKVVIICREHGEFEQTPAKHYNMKQHCPKCGRQNAFYSNRINQATVKNFYENQPEDYKVIPLGDGTCTFVSNEDYEWAKNYCWKNHRGYVRSTKMGALHRLIMNTPSDMFCDHVSRNPLDNRRENLRNVTKQQNTFNSIPYSSSNYKGVHKSGKKWAVNIVHNGEKVVEKRFDCPIQAAKYYDSVIRDYHGEYAYLNFPNG